MKKFVFCKVPHYMSTDVLKNNFLECIFQDFNASVFRTTILNIYFVSFTYFGQKKL